MFDIFLGALQPALNVKRLELGPTMTSSGERALGILEAEPAGFAAAIRRLVGLGSRTTLSVGVQHVRRVDESRWAKQSAVMPVARLSTLHFGYQKSPINLVLGVTLAFAGIVGVFFKPAAIVSLLAGGGLIAYHFVAAQVRYTLAFASVGGMPISLKVKVKDPSDLERLCALVTQMTRSTQTVRPPAMPGLDYAEPAEHTDRVPKA